MPSPTYPPPGWPAGPAGHPGPAGGWPNVGPPPGPGGSGPGRPPGGPPSEGPFLDDPAAPPSNRRVAGLWLLFAFVGYLVGQLCGTVFATAAAAADGKLHGLSSITRLSSPPAWYIGSSLVGLWVGFFLAPFVASKARGSGRLLADFGIRFRPLDLVGILVGVGGQYVIAVLYLPFHVKNLTGPAQKLTGGAHGAGFAVIALLTVVGAPFFEELFFRGVLLRALARLFTPASSARSAARAAGVVLAVVVDGLVFASAHGEATQFAGLALFGMALAAISYRTGRLGMNMVAHASFNLVAVLSLLSSRGGVILH
ncbi:MAG: lysostaphin resistance A-like protein [Acidimicrobiales bacterium]